MKGFDLIQFDVGYTRILEKSFVDSIVLVTKVWLMKTNLNIIASCMMLIRNIRN